MSPVPMSSLPAPTRVMSSATWAGPFCPQMAPSIKTVTKSTTASSISTRTQSLSRRASTPRPPPSSPPSTFSPTAPSEPFRFPTPPSPDVPSVVSASPPSPSFLRNPWPDPIQSSNAASAPTTHEAPYTLTLTDQKTYTLAGEIPQGATYVTGTYAIQGSLLTLTPAAPSQGFWDNPTFFPHGEVLVLDNPDYSVHLIPQDGQSIVVPEEP